MTSFRVRYFSDINTPSSPIWNAGFIKGYEVSPTDSGPYPDNSVISFNSALNIWSVTAGGSSGNATSIVGTAISTATPATGQFLVYNDTTPEWEFQPVTPPTNGQTLVYNSTSEEWEAQTGGSGDATSLQTVPIAAAASSPSLNNILQYNSVSGEWELEPGLAYVEQNLVFTNQAVAITGTAGNSVIFGHEAGPTTVNSAVMDRNVIIGSFAGQNSTTNEAVALGYQAGRTNQSNRAVSIGSTAGSSNQANNAVAIGYVAGFSSQGAQAVAIGTNAGSLDQGINAIAIGRAPGNNNQGVQAIAIGEVAGSNDQQIRAIAIGSNAGKSTQGTRAVAIGFSAGETTQGDDAIAIGTDAGTNTQGVSAVAIGNSAGQTNQSDEAVAIGVNAGSNSQGDDSVAIGINAGANTQGADSVAIGDGAGQTTQGTTSVAVGSNAGSDNQGVGAVGIGVNAGQTNLGANSIAIGASCALLNGAANSIGLNASGSDLPLTNASSFYVRPIADQTTSPDLTSVLHYNETTYEVALKDGIQEDADRVYLNKDLNMNGVSNTLNGLGGNLFSWYEFDGQANRLVDSGPNGNNLSEVGTATSYFEEVSGMTNVIQTSVSGHLENTGTLPTSLADVDFTFTCWFNRGSETDITDYMLLYIDDSTTPFTSSIQIYVRDGIIAIRSIPTGALATSADIYNDGGWHHIAMVITNSGLTVYVDGVDETSNFSVSGTNFRAVSTANRASIGAYYSGGTPIRPITVHPYIANHTTSLGALTSDQVRTLYSGNCIEGALTLKGPVRINNILGGVVGGYFRSDVIVIQNSINATLNDEQVSNNYILDTTSSISVFLPTAPTNGTELRFININTGTITIDAGVLTFDGTVTTTIAMSQYDRLQIIFYGTNWFTF